MLSRQQLDVLFSIARLSQPDAFVMFTRTLGMMLRPEGHENNMVSASDHSPRVEQMLQSRDGSDSGVPLAQPQVIEISDEDEPSSSSSSSEFEEENSDSSAHSADSIVTHTSERDESSSESDHEPAPDGYHTSATGELLTEGVHPRPNPLAALSVHPRSVHPDRKRKHRDDASSSDST